MLMITRNRSVLAAAVLAVGVLVPDVSEAAPIALGDPSFEDYVVPPFPAGTGYAYSNQYRPTSAWVDDLDHFASLPGYNQDDGNSNWLYNSAYAEGASSARKRASPRTGDQAMHGLAYYNAQETGAVFEAQMTYTFSLWAQGDDDASLISSRVFLYLFDGSVPFSEANSLKFRRFAPDTGDFLNRPLGASAAISQGLWREISLSHTVLPGAPEIGHPVGVGFWIDRDGAVDDASLRVDAVPEPGAAALLCLGAMGIVRRKRRRKEHGP
jgi:PEP-CTERM motif